MSRYRANITELSDERYGVYYVVCGNTEVVENRLDFGDEADADADDVSESIRAAIGEVCGAGYDYYEESDFRAYNGGSRKYLVEAVIFERDEFEREDEDGKHAEYDDWQIADTVPPEIAAEAQEIADRAMDAMEERARRAEHEDPEPFCEFTGPMPDAG